MTTRLLSTDGEVVWTSNASVWGATDADVAMPLRFPGQYHDVETGLFYNLNRYYNPDTGRYVTADPLGLAPSPNPHSYVPNPTTQIDPLGLHGADISMDKAIDLAVAHVGPAGDIVISGSGGFQFISHSISDGGDLVTKIGRLDVNPASSHVQNLGPHLNLEVQVNGVPVRGVDPHTGIDPLTIRPVDVP
jgi:RHS repeat-associated protein